MGGENAVDVDRAPGSPSVAQIPVVASAGSTYPGAMVARPSQLDELLRLPAADRSAAAEELLRSLEEADAEGSDPRVAWAAELERRVAHPTPGVPATTVLDEGQRRLRARP